jgi:hypothetical protein
LAHAASQSSEKEKLVAVVRQISWCAERVFVPASLATLIFGAAATWYAGMWGEFRVILGLAGAAATLARGIGVLSPKAKRVGHASTGVTPEIVGTSREILAIATFDMVLLFSVVAVMVIKPQQSDWPVLAVVALVIAATGLWLLGRLRPQAIAHA